MQAELNPRASSPSTPEVRPATARGRILPGLVAGAISGTLIVTFGISLAALIFTGSLAHHVPAGIGVLLFSSFIIGGVVALRSSYKPVISAPQENTSVILALMAAAIGQKLPAGVDALPTILASFALASIGTGTLFALLGLLRLGKIVRYIPYPVIGGFLGGTGWLLVQGSLSVLTGVAITADNAHLLLAKGAAHTWVPGIVFGALVTLVMRRRHHFLLLPGLLAGGVGLFYLVLAVAGISVATAEARGYLLGPFPQGGLWPPFRLEALSRIDWGVLGSTAGSIAALTVLAAISILLNASGLELATDEEIDLDRELRATALANLLSGALGGVMGYLSLSESTLNHKIGARTRLPGLIAAGVSLLTLVAGAAAVSYFPKPILGGLLLFLGLSFLLETVYDAWFRLPLIEYALVLAILLAVVTQGFLAGIGAGLVISAVLFAGSYARIHVVKNVILGDKLRSKASCSAAKESLLARHGQQIHVLQLQGYIFFGTAYDLLKNVQSRLLGLDATTKARFVVLDFRHVDGLDSSAVVAFTRMRKLAAAQGATLAFTELPKSVSRQLERGGCLDPTAVAPPPSLLLRAERPASAVFKDLDHGLEWCENQVVGVLQHREAASESERALVHRIAEYLERIEAKEGDSLYERGQLSKDLILIESGEVVAWLDVEGGRSKRLRTMGPGSVVGEAGLYLGQPRSASVRASRPSVLHRLSAESLARMTREAPELSSALHHYVARLLAERVVETTSTAQMVFYGGV